MFKDTPQSSLSVRRRILLMSVTMTLSNLALCMTRNSRVYFFEQAQCLLYYQARGSTHVALRDSIDESLCKMDDVQYPLSITVGIDSFLFLLPASGYSRHFTEESPSANAYRGAATVAILVLATYEKLLEVKGLRFLLLLNLACSALGVVFSTSVCMLLPFAIAYHRACTYLVRPTVWLRQSWATYVAPFSFAFDLIGGGEMVRLTIIPTCIAKISHPDKLTKTYNYLSGSYLLSGVGGAAFGSLLLSQHAYLLNILSVLCFALTAWLALFIPSDCGRKLDAAESLIPALSPLDEDSPLPPSPGRWPSDSTNPNKQFSLLRVLLQSWQASYQSLRRLFQTPNPVFTVILIILVNGLATNSQVLLPQYTSLVLGWTFATVNAALALKALVSAAVLFLLPTARALVLEPRLRTPQIDLLITRASLVANLVGMVGLGFATSAGPFMLALCVFTTGTGLVDSLYAYGTFSLPPGDQITELYLRLGLVQTIAGLIGAPLWSTVFSLVLKSERLPFGLPFWLCAMLFWFALVGAAALKRWYERGV
ncbi:hypothetical protein MMC26_000725 [Xylographa opegraphella]|nr:hypothetical protein [Xylographa opegraphella]